MLNVSFSEMASPVQTNRNRSSSVRHATRNCCICGGTGDCKGLDVYAAVAYCVDNTRNDQGKWYWLRYLKMLEVLFCSQCVPLTSIDERKRHHQSLAKNFMLVAVCVGLVFAGTIYLNFLPAFWLVVLSLVCVGFLIAASTNYLRARPAALEMSLYVDAVGAYVEANRNELVSKCKIDGVFWRNQYTNDQPYYATREHILFLIEPGRTELIRGDYEQNLQWIFDDPISKGAILPKGEGIMTRSWQ